jgi:hypothetical protein
VLGIFVLFSKVSKYGGFLLNEENFSCSNNLLSDFRSQDYRFIFAINAIEESFIEITSLRKTNGNYFYLYCIVLLKRLVHLTQ